MCYSDMLLERKCFVAVQFDSLVAGRSAYLVQQGTAVVAESVEAEASYG